MPKALALAAIVTIAAPAFGSGDATADGRPPFADDLAALSAAASHTPAAAVAADAADATTAPWARSTTAEYRRCPGPGPDGSAAGACHAEGAHQTLSTLGALALGVLGLLWVRRHTAEL